MSDSLKNYDAKGPFPVDDMTQASELITPPAEIINFILEDGTPDAGSPAGTIVYAQISRAPIYNNIGDRVGRFDEVNTTANYFNLQTSLSFADGVAIFNQQKGFVANLSNDKRLTITASKLEVNGDWALDHETGLMIIKKADATTSLSVTYKIRSGVSTSGGGGIAADVNLNQVAGVAVVDGGVAGSIGVGGNVAHDAVDAGNPIKIGGYATTNQRTAVSADGDRVDSVFTPFGELIMAGYNYVSNLLRVQEVNPLDQKYVIEQFTLTNVPNATPDETSIVNMNGFTGCSIQIEKTGGVDTFTWTMESSVDGTDITANFDDTTQFGFTSVTVTNAASYSSDGILQTNPGFTPQSHKIKIATAGGGDDADFLITVKKYALN